jgi:tetratricopeptide (TPR) repeat protein
VDNIDLIFKGLKDQQQWGLRRILQERGGIVIVGASSGLVDDITKVDAPFYDFFQVHLLEKLSHSEFFTCLRQIALKRGDQGKRVLRVLDTDPARIHTLYNLTGGNPRTLVLLYLLLEADAEGDVMDDLERLLDQVTVLYKARVEDLAPQTRVVLDAVALAWNPVTVAQVSDKTGLEATSISSQFDRLIKMGMLEKVSLSTPAPTGYQLGERFFNIWYLMRNASRRIRNRLRWLTEFLRRLYSPQQISEMADDFIRRSKTGCRCSGVYGMALADAVEDSPMRHTMNHYVTKLILDQAEHQREPVDKLVDRCDLDQATLTMAAMKKLVLECKRDWGQTTAEEFWHLFGGSIEISPACKQELIENLASQEIVTIDDQVNKLREEIAQQDSEIGLPAALNCLRQALRDGLLVNARDLSHAQAAAKDYEDPELILAMICCASRSDIVALTDEVKRGIDDNLKDLFQSSQRKYKSKCYRKYGNYLTNIDKDYDADQAFRMAINLDPKDAKPWVNLGWLLHFRLKRYEEAEQAYRTAIDLDPKDARPWVNLGRLLHFRLKRFEEAERAYRTAIDLDPMDAWPWVNLGRLLHFRLKRYVEAEQAYRTAIDLDPKDTWPWVNLGMLLQVRLERYEEAERAYRTAIDLDPKDNVPWYNLGNLLQYHLERYEEAEQAYRTAIDLDPKDTVPWYNLGNLLKDHLERYEEAEQAYRTAIDLDPKDAELWQNLGNLFQYHLERYEEAEQAYRMVIDLNPKAGRSWNFLGNLLQYHLERYEEAEKAYRTAIDLNPKAGRSWNFLGNLLEYRLKRSEEAEQAYRTAIELNPKAAWSWNSLGNLYFDYVNKPAEAETAYRNSIRHDNLAPYPLANLAYLLLSEPKRLEEAEIVYSEAMKLLPELGKQLLTAFRAMARDNFGEALVILGKTLEENQPELFSKYQNELFRNLRLAKKRGFGDRLLTYLQGGGLGELHWPLYAAFDAYLHGIEKLRDVNPEVRDAARKIFDCLMAANDGQEQALPEKSKKMRRKRR